MWDKDCVEIELVVNLSSNLNSEHNDLKLKRRKMTELLEGPAVLVLFSSICSLIFAVFVIQIVTFIVVSFLTRHIYPR